MKSQDIITARLGPLVMLRVTCPWPQWYFTVLSLSD